MSNTFYYVIGGVVGLCSLLILAAIIKRCQRLPGQTTSHRSSVSLKKKGKLSYSELCSPRALKSGETKTETTEGNSEKVIHKLMSANTIPSPQFDTKSFLKYADSQEDGDSGFEGEREDFGGHLTASPSWTPTPRQASLEPLQHGVHGQQVQSIKIDDDDAGSNSVVIPV